MTSSWTHASAICPKFVYKTTLACKCLIIIVVFCVDFSTAHPYQYELEVFQPPENQLMLHKEEVSSNVQIHSVYKMDIKELEIGQVILSLRVLISLPITFF